jgi:hypothetical protein
MASRSLDFPQQEKKKARNCNRQKERTMEMEEAARGRRRRRGATRLELWAGTIHSLTVRQWESATWTGLELILEPDGMKIYTRSG